MYPGTNAVYGPGLNLLKTLNAQSANSLNQTLGQTRSAFENSVADIAAQQQKQGVDFQGFTQPEYDRYFGANALPALQGLESGVADTNLQLANVLNQLITERGRTGYEFGEKRKGRKSEERTTRRELRQEEKLTNRELSQEEKLTQARLNAETEATRIQAARAAAASSGGVDSGLEGEIQGTLNTARGGDGKVSPESYRDALRIWQANGGSEAAFHNKYYGFVNLRYSDDYYRPEKKYLDYAAKNIKVGTF